MLSNICAGLCHPKWNVDLISKSSGPAPCSNLNPFFSEMLVYCARNFLHWDTCKHAIPPEAWNSVVQGFGCSLFSWFCREFTVTKIKCIGMYVLDWGHFTQKTLQLQPWIYSMCMGSLCKQENSIVPILALHRTKLHICRLHSTSHEPSQLSQLWMKLTVFYLCHLCWQIHHWGQSYS